MWVNISGHVQDMCAKGGPFKEIKIREGYKLYIYIKPNSLNWLKFFKNIWQILNLFFYSDTQDIYNFFS